MNFNPFLLITLILIAINSYAQKKERSIVLYDQGNAAIAVKDFRTADSLFTLSLNIAPHPDSYYNRAVCRRQMKDFKGYCIDLLSASDLGDSESKTIYWNQCAKSDSVYKMGNGEPATKASFVISEFTTTYKYNTNYEYEKKDSAGSILLSKIRKDNITIYRVCDEVAPSEYKGSMDSLSQYIKSQTDVLKLMKENDLAGIVHFLVSINESGTVTEVKLLYGERDELVDKVNSALLNMPAWIPAVYDSKVVKQQLKISVCYYDQEISVSSYLMSTKGLKKEDIKENIKEELPEFPNGISKLGNFLAVRLNYPQRAKEAGLSGKCYLNFVVLPNGKTVNVQVVRGVPGCPECDAEAVRVLREMPKWKPATQNGKPVPCIFNLPINFQLK